MSCSTLGTQKVQEHLITAFGPVSPAVFSGQTLLSVILGIQDLHEPGVTY